MSSDVLASVLAREPDWTRLPAGLSPLLRDVHQTLPAQGSTPARSRHRRRVPCAVGGLRSGLVASRRHDAWTTVLAPDAAGLSRGDCGGARDGWCRVEPLAPGAVSSADALQSRVSGRTTAGDGDPASGDCDCRRWASILVSDRAWALRARDGRARRTRDCRNRRSVQLAVSLAGRAMGRLCGRRTKRPGNQEGAGCGRHPGDRLRCDGAVTG